MKKSIVLSAQCTMFFIVAIVFLYLGSAVHIMMYIPSVAAMFSASIVSDQMIEAKKKEVDIENELYEYSHY